MLWARLLSTSPIHGRICLLKPLCPDEAGGLASWVGHHPVGHHRRCRRRYSGAGWAGQIRPREPPGPTREQRQDT
jgi:hypothetical protein